MKTHKNLYPQIYTCKNLKEAFRKAWCEKRSQPNVTTIERDLTTNLLKSSCPSFLL